MNETLTGHSLQRAFHSTEKAARRKALPLYLMAALYPFIVIPGQPSGFTLPKYAALALAAAGALTVLLSNRSLEFHRTYIPLGLFIAFALTSTVLAPDPLKAWFGVYRYTGFCTYLFCAILFLLAADCSKPKNALTILKWMSAAAAVVSLIAVLQYLGFNFIPHYIHDRMHPYATIGNRNFVGTYTVFILPAAIYFYLHRRKAVWLGCTALIYAGLLVSLTRGAWLALPLPLLILFCDYSLKQKNRKAIWILILILLLTTALLAPVHDWMLLKRALSIPDQLLLALEMEERAGAGRIYIWKETLKLIPANWAFGVGPDHLDLPAPPGFTIDKAHNIYLEIAATMGLFALFAYLWFLFSFLRPGKGKHRFLFFTMTLAYLIQGFFNIDVIGVMPLFWITLGLSLTQERSSSKETPPGP